MLNCSDPECILHHHHYYHGHVQHHLQDDRAHHEHPTHHPMSGESDGVQDAIIQDYLNDTDSELSSLSHLDAPSESVYMICGVLIAMLLVGFIIILLAVTIRLKRPRSVITCSYCCAFCKSSSVSVMSVYLTGSLVQCFPYWPPPSGYNRAGGWSGRSFQGRKKASDKLRKREESSGIHRSNVVHPEGVLQATTIVGAEASPEVAKISPLEDIFIAPVSNRTSFASVPSENSFYSSESTQLPMFLYSTGNSRNSLNSSNDQDVLVHPSGPAEDLENNNNNNHSHQNHNSNSSSNNNNNNNNNINNNNNHSSNNNINNNNNKEEATKKNIKGKLRKLVRRKTPPAENYALPLELREQLKQIYVY